MEELRLRGVSVRVVDAEIELVELNFRGLSRFMMDREGTAVPYLSAALAADEHMSKMALSKAGLRVPEGGLFSSGQIDGAVELAERLGYPVVAKPNVGSHGAGVRSGVMGPQRLESALCDLFMEQARGGRAVVERHIPGHEYRIFVTNKGACAALLREPASVLGDGVSSIEKLAGRESDRRLEWKKLHGSALCPIALDEVALDYLAQMGMDFETVPGQGEKVGLRLSSNLAQGGVSEDVTDKAHPSVFALAKRALAAFEGLTCMGGDFICGDVSQEQVDGSGYAIIEVNANPGLAMHHMPGLGQPRDVAAMVADAMFPEFWSD